jgi:hypothetical protein
MINNNSKNLYSLIVDTEENNEVNITSFITYTDIDILFYTIFTDINY